MQTPILNQAGSTTGGLSTSAARYASLVGGSSHTQWFSSINGANTPMPVAGKFTTWRVELDTAPGASGSGKLWTFELMIGGVAHGTFKFTISETATVGSITVDASHIAQDIIALKATPTGTPAAVTTMYSALVWEGTASGDSVIFGGIHSVDLSTSATQYLAPGALDVSTVQNRSMGVVSTPGTIDTLIVYASANVSTGTRTFELYKSTAASNGAVWTATGVTVTLTGGGRLAIDTTHSFTVAQGDLFGLVSTVASTPTAVEVRWAVRFVPTTAGESMAFGLMTDQVNNPGDTFFNVNGANNRIAGSPESKVYNVVPIACTAKNFIARNTTAPGASKTRIQTLRLNGTDTALTNTLSGASAFQAVDTTNSVSLVAGDKIDVKTNASANFPTAPSQFQFGLTLYIAPSGGGITGTSSKTLAGVTSSGAGHLAIAGAQARTLAGVVGTGVGRLALAAASSKTLAGVSGSGVGRLALLGLSTKTLQGVTNTAAHGGAPGLTGTSNRTLAGVVGTGVGRIQLKATQTKTLAGVTSSSLARLAILGLGNRTLQGVTNIGVGIGALAPIIGSAIPTLQGVTNVGVGLGYIEIPTGALERSIHIHAAAGEDCVVCEDPDDGSRAFTTNSNRWNQLNRRCDPRYHVHHDYSVVSAKRSRALKEERKPNRKRDRDRR